MSIRSIREIKNMVMDAPLHSKIAIFLVKRDGTRELNAVYDGTVLTQRRIKERDENYLGSFYAGSDIKVMTSKLFKALDW